MDKLIDAYIEINCPEADEKERKKIKDDILEVRSLHQLTKKQLSNKITKLSITMVASMLFVILSTYIQRNLDFNSVDKYLLILQAISTAVVILCVSNLTTYLWRWLYGNTRD